MSELPDVPTGDKTHALSPITPGRHHVHISYIALRTVGALKQIAFALVVFGFVSLRRISELPLYAAIAGIVAAAVALIAVLAAFAFISYKHFAWELTESELHIYEGFVFKKETHIPFRRVHSMDYSANVVERALGVVTLRVETAGGGDAAEAQIAALRLSEAEALRFEIFSRKRRLESGAAGPQAPAVGAGKADIAGEIASLSESARGAFAGEYEDASPVEYERRLSLKELFIAGLSNSNVFLLLFAGLAGLSQVIGIVSGSDGAIIDYAQGAAAYLLSFGIFVTAVVTLFALIFAWTISIAATVVSYGGFMVRRRGGRVEIERGLLEHRFTGVALDRIQAVRVKQGALRRLIGFAEVSLETVAGRQSAEDASTGKSGLVVHPLIRLSETGPFIAEMLPEFSGAPTELTPLPPLARGRAIFRSTAWPALVLAMTAGAFALVVQPLTPVPAWLAPLVALVLLAPCPWLGYLSWKTSGYAHDRTALVVRNGMLATDTRIVPRNKIQFAKATSNPFQRRLGLSSFTVRTAASAGGTSITLVDAGDAAATEILAWIEPRSGDVEAEGPMREVDTPSVVGRPPIEVESAGESPPRLGS